MRGEELNSSIAMLFHLKIYFSITNKRIPKKVRQNPKSSCSVEKFKKSAAVKRLHNNTQRPHQSIKTFFSGTT